MRAVDELQGPVGYDDRWLLLAVLGLAAVAAYYAVVLWATRPRPAPAAGPPPREAWLARLDEVESAVAVGRSSPREGHQAISRIVRGFVADAAGVPAATMTLADFEREGPERLAEVVALVYAPAFGPGDDLPRAQLGTALTRARTLVSTWT